ncbi:MAG: putative zinc-binding metallopeptidase [Pseudomonadota bacterium]
MRQFKCRCGRPVYFDNHRCGGCGRLLAFDAERLDMCAEVEPGAGLAFCDYRETDSLCNWLAPAGESVCLSCRTSRVIPALSKSVNRDRWRTLERAKRRLIYDLLRCGLPVDPERMQFAFKEDRRTNPYVDDDHVLTGHNNGLITINAAEADDVYREAMRAQMHEPYRTVLGHFRHESGHHYFRVVVPDTRVAEARALFGDEREDYDRALRRYYENGPPANWSDTYISAYATAHPAEDWAETWAHYLHMQAALEAAESNGLVAVAADATSDWQSRFIELALCINSVQRSLGLKDAYPFVITERISEKLAFVDSLVTAFSRQPTSSAMTAG